MNPVKTTMAKKIRNQPWRSLGWFLFLCPALMASNSLFAGTVIVTDEVSIAVDKVKGALIQLPTAVKTLTPSRYFDIAPAGGDAQTDVRLFQVRPLSGARPERVTFVLGNGKSVSLKLVVSEESDGFFDLVLPSEKAKERNARFLSSEISLMRAMIKDEGGQFARQIKDEKVSLKNLDDFEARLVRVFASQGSFGFVFEVENDSSDPKKLPVTKLTLGGPGKAALVYAEKEILPRCKMFQNSDCKSRVFIVTRGEVSAALSSPTSLFALDPMPFVKAPQEEVAP
jgi:hypothetical protein